MGCNGKDQIATLSLSGERVAVEMQRRCQLVVDELEQFQEYLEEHKMEENVVLAGFRRNLEVEMRLLNKLVKQEIEDGPLEGKSLLLLSSCNFPFFEAVWDAAKRSEGIIALRKRAYWAFKKAKGDPWKYSVYVDLISKDGSEWTKISTMTERRCIMELAKAGWVAESSGEESDGGNRVDDSEEPEGLLKLANSILKASRAIPVRVSRLTSVRYRHPTVYLVMTRISRNCQKPVADILSKIESLGIVVQYADELPEPPMFSQVLSRLVVNPYANLSDVLNVDCSLLLALVSDLSHGHVSPEDCRNKFLKSQMEAELQDQFLPDTLWPIVGSRKLVCTREAVNKMLEIVGIIGTKKEKLRTRLLVEPIQYIAVGGTQISDTISDKSGCNKVGFQELTNLSSNFQVLFPDLEDTAMGVHVDIRQRIDSFQQLSQYAVPTDWQLPIEVVDFNMETMKANLPPVAQEVAKELSELNQSVFLYGWATGRTTISSNTVCAKQIEKAIMNNLRATGKQEVAGPNIWVSKVARSLVGIMKQKTGSWHQEADGQD